MRQPRRAARVGAACCGIAVIALTFPLAAFLAQSASAADTSGNGGGNLTVVVTDGETPSPTPSPTPTVGPSGSGTGQGNSNGQGNGSGNGNGSGDGQGTGTGQGAGAQHAGTVNPASKEVSMSGILFVGGLMSSTAPSINPGAGTVALWFTVRNESTSTIDATARFWMDSVLLGIQVDAVDDVLITGLQPGETRVVTTELHNAGQWTALNAHVTLTPPATVDGKQLSPITRDATIVMFPWLLTTGGIVGGVAIVFALLGRGLFAAVVLPRAT
ncbi:hypothetical protein ABCS02_08550 [Microbacterium sp. X-17]|uniref:hypothetical protein n=1 Tax=Microbacterium sp. X-17 TaxID=3144404 RepID=UPI0031F5AFBA